MRKKKNIIKSCKRHGKVRYTLDIQKRYRCAACRVDAVTKRRKNIKLELIKLFGGKCVRCGYKKCVGALHFHHKNPKTKKFALSARGITRAFEKTLEEAKKCILICSNCHSELHEKLAAR